MLLPIFLLLFLLCLDAGWRIQAKLHRRALKRAVIRRIREY